MPCSIHCEICLTAFLVTSISSVQGLERGRQAGGGAREGEHQWPERKVSLEKEAH